VALIELRDVSKSFHRVTVLDQLNFTVDAGELVGLMGPNGAGKSTALKILTGQLLPDSGQALLGGHDIQTQPLQARLSLGYVPQEPDIEPFLTGTEVLRFVCKVRDVDPEPIVDTLLSTMSLTEASGRLSREYSEGMLRRLAIAAAFIGKPPALVLDESLNGLDPRGARIVRQALEDRRATGAAIILTGHVLETLERMCTRVVLLHEGRIALDVTKAEIAELIQSGRTLEDLFLEATESSSNG
jgi:ABC-2 type transport system ATP-binding protein